MINTIGFAPAGGFDLVSRHADTWIATALTLGRGLRVGNVRRESDQFEGGNISRPTILQLNVVIGITGYAPFDTVQLWLRALGNRRAIDDIMLRVSDIGNLLHKSQ